MPSSAYFDPHHSGPPAGLIVAGVFAFLLLVYVIVTYNTFIRLRQHCRDAWSGIETELKRRYDLIPNLVETVKGYAKHESETLERVIAARNRALESRGAPGSQEVDERELVRELRGLLAVSEGYPELRASRSFLDLQHELAITEDRIQAARRFYNGNVRDLNIRIEVFPSNLIAGLAGAERQPFFEVENALERNAPRVTLDE